MIDIIKLFYKFFYSKIEFNIYTANSGNFVLKKDKIKINFGFHLFYDFGLHGKKLHYKNYGDLTKNYLFII